MKTKNVYLPFKTTIADVAEIAKGVRLFSIEVPGDFSYQPGQFVMVSILGTGEVPISISSAPGLSARLELCIRAVGRVTSALSGLEPGDPLWLRGPYGRAFPANGVEDILFICGGIGIVPLRPLIKLMILRLQKSGNGRVTVLYGSRNPSEVLFLDEVQAWREQGADVIMTVDTSNMASWKGYTGLVTDHFGRVKTDFRNGMAYICGPHIMIEAAMRDLALMGMPDYNIITTLEAHMKCGVGKCGHCYCGQKLICEEGPVFSFQEIKKYNIKAGRDSLE